jgi:flagellar motor switch protein FliN/FliY
MTDISTEHAAEQPAPVTPVAPVAEAEPVAPAPPRPSSGAGGINLPLEALQDVEMKVEVVLGRVRLRLQEILGLRPGQVIELDRTRNSPVEILVNGTLFAHGEIVVIDDNQLGVRIGEIVTVDTGREGR